MFNTVSIRNMENTGLTVFAWLAAENDCGCVSVVTIDVPSTGRKVVAIRTEEVGQRGFVSVLTILVGGIGCIGANLVGPSCRLYGVPHAPWSRVAFVSPPAIALTAFGPALPSMSLLDAITAAENTPVIPVRVNRSE